MRSSHLELVWRKPTTRRPAESHKTSWLQWAFNERELAPSGSGGHATTATPIAHVMTSSRKETTPSGLVHTHVGIFKNCLKKKENPCAHQRDFKSNLIHMWRLSGDVKCTPDQEVAMYPLSIGTCWPIRSLKESINSSATGTSVQHRGRRVCGLTMELLLNIKLEFKVSKRQEEQQLTGVQCGGRAEGQFK